MYYFVVNLHGGSGRALLTWRKVKRTLLEKKVVFKARYAQYPGHASVIAQEIVSAADDDIRIVVVGGDGTINEVINGLGDIASLGRVSFGVIPTGSGNDYARGLGLHRHNFRKALDTVLNCPPSRSIDIGHVVIFHENECIGNRFFAISSGFGIDALVCKKVDTTSAKPFFNALHIGKLSYIIMTIRNFLALRPQELVLSFDGHKVDYHKVVFVACMNFPCEGGGVPMNPSAICDDGLFSVSVCSGVSVFGCFVKFPVLLMRLPRLLRCFSFHDCKTFDLYCPAGGTLHTDGEVIEGITSAKFDCLHNVLRVFC